MAGQLTLEVLRKAARTLEKNRGKPNKDGYILYNLTEDQIEDIKVMRLYYPRIELKDKNGNSFPYA